jgi:hypothetical protein
MIKLDNIISQGTMSGDIGVLTDEFLTILNERMRIVSIISHLENVVGDLKQQYITEEKQHVHE